MLKLWTSRIDYKAKPAEVVINTTAQSSSGVGKVFAPTWDLVMSIKAKVITWETYTQEYYQLLRDRYNINRYAFQQVCMIENDVVLLCYCHDKSRTNQQCHRYLLIDILMKTATSMNIASQYMGEAYNEKKGDKNGTS